MTELDKLRTSVAYLDRLISGKHPNTGDVLFDVADKKNSGIINCLSFVKDYLVKHVVEQTAEPAKFALTEQAKRSISIYPEGLNITKFVEMINAAALEPGMDRLRGRQVTRWLMKNGYLSYQKIDGKNFRLPTQKGTDLGISSYEYKSDDVKYAVNIYDANAQAFILAHIDDIVENRKIPEE